MPAFAVSNVHPYGLDDMVLCRPRMEARAGHGSRSSVLFFALLVIVVFLFMITISSISFLGGIRIALSLYRRATILSIKILSSYVQCPEKQPPKPTKTPAR